MFLEMFTIVGAIAGAVITLASCQRFLYLLFGIVLLVSWVALFIQRRMKEAPERRSSTGPVSQIGDRYSDVHPLPARGRLGGLLCFCGAELKIYAIHPVCVFGAYL